MNGVYAKEQLLADFMAERHALGFDYHTGEGSVKRFLKNYTSPADGNHEFTKKYVLENTKRQLNQCNNTVLRDVAAVNCFLDFVARKGFKAYRVPPKSLPKEQRNFKARIFTDDEIERLLAAADATPFSKQNPDKHHQIPVMFRILFNCGLRVSELLSLRLRDVDLVENVLTVLDTKFHKNRLVPFSEAVADALKDYLKKVKPRENDFIFKSPKTGNRYQSTMIHVYFKEILFRAGFSHGGRGAGPRPHDIRHTFAVHCLNNWVLDGVDLMAALPVLSRYLGHSGIKGTQKYLQLTAQMYPNIVEGMESRFGDLIPQPEVHNEAI